MCVTLRTMLCSMNLDCPVYVRFVFSVTVQNSAANLTLTATCVAAVVFRVFRRISAVFRSLISPTFLPTIHREFKKLHSSTPPVATTTSVSRGACVHIIIENTATVARVSYKLKRISCNSTVCITNEI
jgi:hypothetical protein